MQEIDMSRPGSELFPETAPPQYNSYTDTAMENLGDPLNTGAKQPDVAGQVHMSEIPETAQQKNFRALREEVAKMQAEREYWKGQAEAYARIPTRQPESAPTTPAPDAYAALDLEDSRDVRKAFDAIRQENQTLRSEIKDALTAIETKTQRQDWNSMVTQHVPQLTSKNPIFAEMIQNASNPYEAAYLLAELNAKAMQPAPNPAYESSQGQRAIANAHKPQTLASVGGQGQLSAADYYASMSDEDFMKIASRNLANI
jgi:hypothetical protein